MRWERLLPLGASVGTGRPRFSSTWVAGTARPHIRTERECVGHPAFGAMWVGEQCVHLRCSEHFLQEVPHCGRFHHLLDSPIFVTDGTNACEPESWRPDHVRLLGLDPSRRSTDAMRLLALLRGFKGNQVVSRGVERGNLELQLIFGRVR
jgi:hypothetical protein